MNDSPLRLDIMVSNLGLRLHIPESELDDYKANPVAYVAVAFDATEMELRTYLATEGCIQCMQVLGNGRQCRNKFGVHANPGQLPFDRWLQLDRSGWYCHVHAEGT